MCVIPSISLRHTNGQYRDVSHSAGSGSARITARIDENTLVEDLAHGKEAD
jgi:hypothetical protein